LAQHKRRQADPGRYPRTVRVNAVLREVIAEELERLSDIDERLRLVTVTSIETDRDLSRARVYLASLTDEVAESLGEHRWRLQAAIARQVRLKRTPTLEFVADPAVAAGERVDRVLRDLRHEGQ
jgi:ribosome-binding factor A